MNTQSHKTGLERRRVAKGHFSVRDSKDDFSTTRFVLRVLKGAHLLASDLMTTPPSSDPICFGWCGFPQWSSEKVANQPSEIEKEWGSDPLTTDGGRESNDQPGNSTDGKFKTTRVVPGTLDPIWDEELEFDVGELLKSDAQKRLWIEIQAQMEEQERLERKENGKEDAEELENPLKRGEPTEQDYKDLEIEMDSTTTLQRLMEMKCFCYIRDADPAYSREDDEEVPSDVTYDSLGRVLINFGDVIEKAKFANGTLVTNCLSYPVLKAPGMPSMARGVDLGYLFLGCSLILGNDEAGRLIKTALTPEYVEKALDAKAFCLQLKKAQKGESLEIKPSIDLTGRRRTNSRSMSPTRARPGTAGTSTARASLNSSLQQPKRPNTSQDSRRGNKSRMSMRNSLDLSKVNASIKKATSVTQEVSQTAPWKNKAAQRYDNDNDEANTDVVISKQASVASISVANNEEKEEEGTRDDNITGSGLPDGLSVANLGGGDENTPPPEFLFNQGGGDEALPEDIVGDSEGKGAETSDFPDAPEVTGVSKVLEDVSSNLPDNAVASSSGTASGTPSKILQNSSSSSVLSGIGGSGSKAVKALRPSNDGSQNDMQRTLLELKQLTIDSLKELSGRMSQIENRLIHEGEGSRSPTRAGGNGSDGASSQVISNMPKKSAPPSDAALARKVRQGKREERNTEFKNFKDASKQIKNTKRELDVANGLPRGSCDGPIIEFIHGSKMNNNISAARLGDDVAPHGGSPTRRNGGEDDEGGYSHAMHTHGGSNNIQQQQKHSQSVLSSSHGGGGGDRSGSGSGTFPPQHQYHATPGTPGPTGLGHPPQPRHLNAAPLPIKAPQFASPDWSRVDVWLRAGDIVSAYCEVLDRGSPEDFGRLLLEGGIHPYALSASILNRVCDMVSLILLQGSGQFTEICLLFILSVLRDTRVADKPSSASVLLGRTKHALSESLTLLASKANHLPSKQALLAGLLQTQLIRL